MSTGPIDKIAGSHNRTSFISWELVERLRAFRLERVPNKVVAQAKLVLLDTIGEMICASRLSHPTMRRLAEFAGRPERERGSTLVGRGGSSRAADAAFFNAALAAFGLKDPIHTGTAMHAPATVAATALAVAESSGAGGEVLLEAFLVGTEVACRVSAALDPGAVYRRGFHPTAVCGTFGATAAAAHILRLEPHRLAAALGLALQQAAGHISWMSDPSDSSRPLSPALAARNGTSAALLASFGLGGPPMPFDGRHSVFATFSGKGRPSELLRDWGTHYYMAEITHKLHASCTYTHAAVDALFLAVTEGGITPSEVAGITLWAPTASRALITDAGLRSCYAPYILAIGLVFGEVTIEAIADDRSDEPEVARLIRSTEVIDDPEADGAAATIELSRNDRGAIRRRVDAAKGTARNPLSEAEITQKYTDAVKGATSAATVSAILEKVQTIESLASLDDLFARLRDLPA